MSNTRHNKFYFLFQKPNKNVDAKQPDLKPTPPVDEFSEDNIPNEGTMPSKTIYLMHSGEIIVNEKLLVKSVPGHYFIPLI